MDLGSSHTFMAHGEMMHQQLSVVGFILVNSSFEPIYFNTEALKVLTYPIIPKNRRAMNHHIAEKFRSVINNNQSRLQFPFLSEFSSGRRRYLCYAFSLTSHSKRSPQSTMGFLILRSFSESTVISRMTDEFNLTQREREVVENLMKGFSSKEIADGMKISPNTVNSFFRLIMIKMGVSTRSGIMGKIIKSQHLQNAAQSLLNAHNPSQATTPDEG